MAESNSNDPERWRSKYYDQLEELERKEKEWRRDEELLRQGLLRLSLAAEHGDEALDRILDQLRTGLRRGAASAELTRLFDGIAEGVARLERLRKEQGGGSGGNGAAREVVSQLLRQVLAPRAEQEAKLLLARAASADGSELNKIGTEFAKAVDDLLARQVGLPLHTALLQLVEYLPIPAEFTTEVESIKGLLANPLAEAEVDPALRRIAELVGAVRRTIMDEKRELEGFLRMLTENLQELDQNLHATVMEQLASFSEGRKLGDTMSAQMQDLEDSVQAASELDVLKVTIQQRVQTIRGHMEAFRQAEERRRQQAEQSVAALTARLEEVEREAGALRERIRAERSQALLDPLTGIFNRLAYDERLDQEFQRWKRYRSALTLVVWDIDRFKRINDSFGHQAGDKVLKVVAKLLSAQVRSTDFLCRYGGEEFVLLLPETNLKQALVAAEKLRASVEAAEFHYRGEQVKITVSCGVAEFTSEDTPDEVFARADRALYQAKAQGRNCCRGL